LKNLARDRAQRLITVIRDRAFAELAQRQGELAPMALTMDDSGRIAIIAVYTGDAFPDPANHLADLLATLKQQAGKQTLESVATAHRERVILPYEAHPLDSVCVQYEVRNGKPLRVCFPYRIKVKLRGDSEITRLAPVPRAGLNTVFRTAVDSTTDRSEQLG
jgi:hypothetical protein